MRSRWLLSFWFLCTPAVATAFSEVKTSAGAVSHWAVVGVPILVGRDAAAPSRELDETSVEAALAGALATWSGAPEARIQLELGAPAPDTGTATPSLNLVRFIQHDWPHAANQLASTQVYSHPLSGEIVAAVIEVNEAEHEFTAGGGAAAGGGKSERYDLQAVLTHELGHLLGLGHSTDESTTMFASTAPGDAHQRSLAADDRQGLAAIYDATPPLKMGAVGCTMGGGRASAPGALVVMLLLFVLFARRSVRHAA